MPMVETSVAVATPSTTAVRITKGSSKAGTAMANVFSTRLGGARVVATWSDPARHQATTASTMARTKAGMMPAVNSAAMDIPVTEAMAIRTSEGGRSEEHT